MTKIFYLHIGLHKTASTSFQSTCRRNSQELKKSGITFPSFNCEAANMTEVRHEAPLKSLFSENPKKYYLNQKWGVVEKILQVNSSYEYQLEKYLEISNHLLLSGEGISKFNEKEMTKLIQRVEKYNYEIKVVALVRNPYLTVCSSIQEVIKSGSYVKLITLNNKIPDFFSVDPYRKSHIVQKFKSIFGDRVDFYAFEQACAHRHGPVGFLMDKFLNQDPDIYKYEKKNESMHNLSVRVFNEFNKGNSSSATGWLKKDFQRFPPHVDKRFNFSGKFLLTELEYSLVKEFVESERDALQATAGLTFDTQLRFSKPIY